MESDRIKTGLYNRAKNSNNNSNHINPISNKAKILNVNSLNFMKNEIQEEEIEEEYNDDINEILNNELTLASNKYKEENFKCVLPNIIQNKVHNKMNNNNIKNIYNNSKRTSANIQCILDNYDTNLLPKQNKITTSNAISKRIPSAKNLLNTKSKQTNIKTNNYNNENCIKSSNNYVNNNSKLSSESNKNINFIKEEKVLKAPLPAKKPTVRKFKTNTVKEFLKESSIKSIQLFLDPKSLKNFILACKKFYNYCLTNDDLWFNYYVKKYKIKPTKDKYSENMGKWRDVFLKSLKKIFDQNFDQIKNKFLKHFDKNKYQISKDPYNIANLVYNNMKPKYSIEIDGKVFPVKHIFTNKILSHINFFINFDQEFLDYRKANKIKLLLNEKNLGFSDIKIYEIELKKKKFLNLENEEIKSKICNIFSYNEFIFSTFEKIFIFFINISLPICKICEKSFEFLNGIHGKNLLYEDDISKDFGLYEYVLLLNIKSWKEIFFTLHVNKLDFKKDLEDPEYIYYENDSRSKLNYFKKKKKEFN